MTADSAQLSPAEATGRVRVGLSGWTYSEWRGDFYPEGLPAKQRLAYASERFSVLEVNASFYRTLRATTYAGWRDGAAPGTVFAVKGPKFVTHIRRLVDVEESLEKFWTSGVLGLGDALGPILWQLPPSLRFDAAVVDGFLTALPRERDGVRLRHALEPRHASWDAPEAESLLREHGVAFVTSDLAGRYPMFSKVTAELVYVRLHGHEQLYFSGYSREQLRQWADRLSALADQGARRDGVLRQLRRRPSPTRRPDPAGVAAGPVTPDPHRCIAGYCAFSSLMGKRLHSQRACTPGQSRPSPQGQRTTAAPASPAIF